jgi:hypothetical protein
MDHITFLINNVETDELVLIFLLEAAGSDLGLDDTESCVNSEYLQAELLKTYL